MSDRPSTPPCVLFGTRRFNQTCNETVCRLVLIRIMRTSRRGINRLFMNTSFLRREIFSAIIYISQRFFQTIDFCAQKITGNNHKPACSFNKQQLFSKMKNIVNKGIGKLVLLNVSEEKKRMLRLINFICSLIKNHLSGYSSNIPSIPRVYIIPMISETFSTDSLRSERYQFL